MRKETRIFLIASFLFLCSFFQLKAQLYDAGGIGSIALSKELGQFTELTLEQELRFDRGFSSLNRSSTSIGADFTIIRRTLKAGVAYDLHYRRNSSNMYEVRHRISASVVGQYRYERFIFKLRSRAQATIRDESSGDYKYNPKYVWRNRLMVEYNIRRSPFRPYVSGEIFCPLNSDYGFFMDSYRLTIGTEYSLSKRSSLDFQFRFDQDIQQADARNILYGGVSWNYSF
ncbi:DUF2490 domain-containing protein [Paludibacter sp. 221]|uniref:DUF2490 domain-containing protein n=1 Tax=Paludibacter sp. 221 TaxID=2302939 RepID=UPI0013D7C41C|nr:DUF2490 domain-containing protein [Paludibacter sp. 221]NDV46671.1 DUF2490 domain-containing protein [Paludibacter sp. 221]